MSRAPNVNNTQWSCARQRVLEHEHTLEPFPVSEGDDDAIAECVEEVVLAVALLVPDPETFDLVEQVVSRTSFVGRCLVESVFRVLDLAPVDVARYRNCPLDLAHLCKPRINRVREQPTSPRLLQENRPGTLVLDKCAYGAAQFSRVGPSQSADSQSPAGQGDCPQH